jgi:hypothetical protein
MIRALRLLAQLACLVAIAALIGWFSVAPAYTHRAPGTAEVKLSFAHGAARPDCHQLTKEELARLPSQMRRPTECPRGRPAVHLLFRMDGSTLLDAELPPSGLSGDGPSRIYRVFPVRAGEHQVSLLLHEPGRDADYRFERGVFLTPGQNLVIDFRPTTGGFYLR